MPREIMTIRLDRATRVRLTAVAKRRRLTPSGAARLALETWLEAEDATARVSPYEQMRDLIGCVSGGDALRSKKSGLAIAEMLRRHRGGKR
jgi:hypothetical protein